MNLTLSRTDSGTDHRPAAQGRASRPWCAL